jgi:tRNA modification GTPase
LRPAEAGEFVRRSFLGGKLDLPAVEGLADLIEAETEGQRRQALRQARGALGRAITFWREELIDALALLEASIDFADEGDVGERLADDLAAPVRRVALAIRATLAGAARGERLREGFRVVIAGPPNVGKSTLLNALARRDVAIVSPLAGTTRDLIEVHLDLAGWPVVLVDTAGLRDAADLVEEEGVRRARVAMAEADLILWLKPIDSDSEWNYGDESRAIRVATKADVGGAGVVKGIDGADVAISAASGEGLDDLLELVASRAKSLFGGEPALVAHERQRVALERCAGHAEQALGLVRDRSELAAEHLRLALRELGRVAGAVDVEDVLGRIFSRFCIGK